MKVNHVLIINGGSIMDEFIEVLKEREIGKILENVSMKKYGTNQNIATQNTKVAVCLLNEFHIPLKNVFLYQF